MARVAAIRRFAVRCAARIPRIAAVRAKAAAERVAAMPGLPAVRIPLTAVVQGQHAAGLAVAVLAQAAVGKFAVIMPSKNAAGTIVVPRGKAAATGSAAIRIPSIAVMI